MSFSRGISTALLLNLAAATCAGEPSFPYSARVRVAGAHVRSGPGPDYYPTDKLAASTEVEVYRHDEQGWCAIRPPRHSYSWVSSRHVALIDNNLAEVTDESAPSRIGSRFSNVRTSVHVRLERGELLEVIDTYNGGGQTWYKVAPPSGEFRWIAMDDLEIARDAEPPAIQLAAHDAPPLIYRQAKRERREVIHEPLPEERPAEPAAPQTRWRRAAADTPGQAPGQRAAASGVRSSQPWQRPDRAATSRRGTPDRVLAARRDEARRAAAEFEQQLMDVEQDVASMLADDPSEWYADRLLHEVDVMADVAPTADLRGQAERLGDRIANLDRIYSRRMALAGDAAWSSDRVETVPPESAPPRPRPAARSRESVATPDRSLNERSVMVRSHGPATHPSPRERPDQTFSGSADPTADAEPNAEEVVVIPEDRPATQVDRPRFDGEGVLRSVVSRRRDAPRYALVDATGDVVSFITPSPGVNLQPFVGRRVGVTGTRGFMVDYQRDHITAARVTPSLR